MSPTCTVPAALRSATRTYPFGPSYFMRLAVHSDGGLAQVFRASRSSSLLEEFHFGDRNLDLPFGGVTVDLDARYGLAALEKSLTTGE